MSKPITPSKKAEVIAMLEAGFSKSATARETNLNISTIKRIAKDPSVKIGKNHRELVARASEALNDALSSEFAKRQLASLVVDDLAIAAGLRDNIATLNEQVTNMKVTNLKEAGAKARTLAAIATANKLSTDNLRQVLQIASPQVELEELPELIVTEMLEREVTAIREEQDQQALEEGLITKINDEAQ